MSGDELIRMMCDLAVAGKGSPKDGGITMRGDGHMFPRTRYRHIVHRRVWRDGRWVPITTRKRNRRDRVHAGEVVVKWIDNWAIQTGYLILGSFTPGYEKLEVRDYGDLVRIYLPDGRVIDRPSPRA